MISDLAKMSIVELAGFAEDALAYFVSKHGVVTLTRSFSKYQLFCLKTKTSSTPRTLNASFHESGHLYGMCQEI